jgi:hypothetical protein
VHVVTAAYRAERVLHAVPPRRELVHVNLAYMYTPPSETRRTYIWQSVWLTEYKSAGNRHVVVTLTRVVGVDGRERLPRVFPLLIRYVTCV